MRILRVIISRIILLVPTLFGLVTIMFFLTYYLPADPVGVAAGPVATKEQKDRIKKLYGFDKPVHVQYLYYIKRIVFKADFGRSLYTQREIRDDLFQRLSATLELAFWSLNFGIFFGILFGVYSAIKRNSLVDHLIRGITIAAISLASFWIAIELQLVFGYSLGLTPLLGRIDRGLPPLPQITGFYLIDSILTLNPKHFLSSLAHLILPVTTLALIPLGTIARFTRTGVLDVMGSGFVLYGRAMGLSQRLLTWKYILKNALVSTIAQIGLLFGYVLAGTFVVEKIFMWPGIGSYALDSILFLDYKAVFAVSLWAGVVYSVGSLLADILLILIDPREITK